ncbi:hypothetical protein N7507_000558 [Penicillium longicatenatum]|nr:hypothetical protein N7507_000558 [Penicillium longicatenatum]
MSIAATEDVPICLMTPLTVHLAKLLRALDLFQDAALEDVATLALMLRIVELVTTHVLQRNPAAVPEIAQISTLASRTVEIAAMSVQAYNQPVVLNLAEICPATI